MANFGTKYGYKEDGTRFVRGYYAEFSDPHRRPKRKRLSLKTRDKRVARQKFATLEREVALGIRDPWVGVHDNADALLPKTISLFVKSREEHCSKQTVSTYRYVLEAICL